MPDVETTDAELIRLAADKVMGWTAEPEQFWNWTDAEGQMVREYWNPLTSDTDCWMLVEKLPQRDWYIRVERGVDGWAVLLRHIETGARFSVLDPDRRRAIVTACIKVMDA